MNPELVKLLFKYCNISLKTDDSKDDLLFNYEKIEEILKANQYDKPKTIKINNDKYFKEEYINCFAENIKTIIKSSNKN
ncbi:4697_t:CDS:1, partial [Cetraspora pellucida]